MASSLPTSDPSPALARADSGEIARYHSSSPSPEPPSLTSGSGSAVDPDIIDRSVFAQIIDLDDGDPSHEFSQGMAFAFLAQAEDKLQEMETALINRDLAQLSKLGHFLKGSAAALGVWKLQYSCEKIQQHGELVDEEKELTEEEALATIGTLLKQAKEEYKDADTELRRWYDDNQSLRSATP